MSAVFLLQQFRNYAISLVVFLVIDMVWLVGISKSFYSKQLGYLMAPKVNFLAAFLFYAIFIVGLSVFVIYPALTKGSWTYAIFYGLLFGLVTYSTYDLTNLATVKDWPLVITVIDLVWGSVVCALTSVISYLIIKLF